MLTLVKATTLVALVVIGMILSFRGKKYHFTCNLIFILVGICVTGFFPLETMLHQFMVALFIYVALFLVSAILVKGVASCKKDDRRSA